MTNLHSRKNDIDALVANVKSEYKAIEGLYNASLHKKEIDPNLNIKVKNYLENARSILDYCAHAVADVAGVTSDKIYFPIVERTSNAAGFQGSIGRNLPGLESKNSKLFNYFESIQPYHADYSWLGDFVMVTNDTKHSQLTPQTKSETQRVVSQHVGGGEVSWNPSAVRFGSGVFINGAPVNPVTQLPVSTPETIIKIENWVDFKFMSSVSALTLLKKIHDVIPTMIDEVYKLI